MNQDGLKELILNVCLENNKEKKESFFRIWEKNINIDDIDYDSMRLIPYLLYQLNQSGIKTIHEKRFKVLYKFWWLKTKHLSDQLKIICDNLKNNDIQPIILKGGNLMFYYPEPELRPMADIDLMVSFHELERTLSLLKELGYNWKPKELFFIKYFPELTFDFYHALSLKNDKLGVLIDLHWRTGSQLSYSFDEDLSKNIIQHPFIDSALQPKIEYEIFLSIIHAVISSSRDNLNWIIDMSILIQSINGEIWVKVEQIAIKENKIELLQFGIFQLKKFGFEIPLQSFDGLKKNTRVLALDKDISLMKNPFKIFIHRYNNTILIISCLFPNANKLQRIVHFFRFIFIQVFRYFYLYRKFI